MLRHQAPDEMVANRRRYFLLLEYVTVAFEGVLLYMNNIYCNVPIYIYIMCFINNYKLAEKSVCQTRSFNLIKINYPKSNILFNPRYIQDKEDFVPESRHRPTGHQ